MPKKPAGRSRASTRPPHRAAPKASKSRAGASAANSRNARRSPAPATRAHKGATRSAGKPDALPKGTAPSKRQLEAFKRQLEAERARLTEELEAIEEHQPEIEQVSVDAAGGYDEDLADVASDTFEREKGIAIENSVHELLEQVEEALARIEEGTFGVCEICAQPIHLERLRALPYARLCIKCKAREEQAVLR